MKMAGRMTYQVMCAIVLSVSLVGCGGSSSNSPTDTGNGMAPANVSGNPQSTDSESVVDGSPADQDSPPAPGAALQSITLSAVSLDQIFQSTQRNYTARVGFAVDSISISAIPADGQATVSLAGTQLAPPEYLQTVPLAVGDNEFILQVENGSVSADYNLSINRASADAFRQRDFLKASTVAASGFGEALALAEGWLAIGAPGDGAEGSVYLYRREGNSWIFSERLAGPAADSRFGISIGMSADYLAVGAPGAAFGALNNAGAVFLYHRTDSGWAAEATLSASNAGPGDSFGQAVAMAGTTLLVGAPGEDAAGSNAPDDNTVSNAGAAYVFELSGGWSEEAYLKLINSTAQDNFGIAVSVSGNRLAVGAPSEDSSAAGVGGDPADNSLTDSGAVLVFERSADGWLPSAYAKAGNPGEGDGFGISVSIDDALLAVGAYREDGDAASTGAPGNDAAVDAGAVYVFSAAGGSWRPQGFIKPTNVNVSDGFGSAVSISGSGLLVGSNGDDGGGTGVNADQTESSASSAGAAYLWSLVGDAWQQTAFIKASNTDANDAFGSQVLLVADTAVIAAPLEDGAADSADQADNSVENSGAVYVFE